MWKAMSYELWIIYQNNNGIWIAVRDNCNIHDNKEQWWLHGVLWPLDVRQSKRVTWGHQKFLNEQLYNLSFHAYQACPLGSGNLEISLTMNEYFNSLIEQLYNYYAYYYLNITLNTITLIILLILRLVQLHLLFF